MTSCILTIIKNEHEYLDEFIRYHLNIGIEHIFIFEDIDSESHKDITDKYDHVTLDSIYNILEYEKEKTLKNKDKKIGYQSLYTVNGLLYIQKHYCYDWCFVLDCDEYITTNEHLDVELNKFNGYDSILLYWKIYNASGHVTKPDYTNNGLIDTYTEIYQSKPNETYYDTKICFNLHSFKREHFMHVHRMKNNCRWCRTDFSNDMNSKLCYDKIYLRHYMTKSWEEYIHKLNVRGMFHPGHRKIDDFFKYNPDMIDKKDELLKQYISDMR